MKISEKLRICYFSKNFGSDSVIKGYTLNDFNILKELGYEVIPTSNFKDLISIQADLYFCWWASSSWPAVFIAKFLNKPVILISGGNEVTNYFDSITNKPKGYAAMHAIQKLVVKTNLRFASINLAVSHYIKEHLIAKNISNVEVVHNCVDTQKFSYSNKSRDERDIILSISNFDRDTYDLKRVSNLMKAFKIIHEDFPHLKLFIFGKDGPCIKDFNSEAKRLQITDNVKARTFISNDELASYFSKALIFAQPSDTETFGLSLVEAMSSGIPIVTSRVGAIPEVVGKHAIFVNQNSYHSIAEGLKEIISMNDDSYDALRLKLNTRACTFFDKSIRKHQLDIIIRSLLNNYVEH